MVLVYQSKVQIRPPDPGVTVCYGVTLMSCTQELPVLTNIAYYMNII